MVIDKVIALAVLSGKGGVGKSVISLNLALALGRLGVKTLLFDAAGGDLANLANAGGPRLGENISENVSLCFSAAQDFLTMSDEEYLENLLAEIARAVSGYSCVVFDCPTGAGSIPFILASIAEKAIVITTPDPTSIAGAYLLLKSLHHDNLSARCGIIFNRVKSADEAASLKTRFDIMTRKFLNHRFGQIGHIHDDSILAESVLDQRPLLLDDVRGDSGPDFVGLAEKLRSECRFHFETGGPKSLAGYGV